MSMRRKAILIASILIIVLGLVGFAYFRNYKTIVNISKESFSGYDLVVEVKENYGPFGGVGPVSFQQVWVFKDNSIYSQNYTDNTGIVKFNLPQGNYYVYLPLIHEGVNVYLSSNLTTVVTFIYAPYVKT